MKWVLSLNKKQNLLVLQYGYHSIEDKSNKLMYQHPKKMPRNYLNQLESLRNQQGLVNCNPSRTRSWDEKYPTVVHLENTNKPEFQKILL